MTYTKTVKKNRSIFKSVKEKRTLLRTAVTELISTEIELHKKDINHDTLEESIELLKDKFEHLNVTDSDIEKLLNPEDIDREFQSSVEYREKVILCKSRASKRIKQWKIQNLSKGGAKLIVKCGLVKVGIIR